MYRYVHTIFCEDLRQEIAGKKSYIGVYGTELYVQKFPTIVPKLVIDINVVTEKENPFQHIHIDIFLLSKRIGDIDLPSEELKTLFNANKSHPDTTRAMLQLNTTLVPFVIEGPGLLEVIVTADGQELPKSRLILREPNSEAERESLKV